LFQLLEDSPTTNQQPKPNAEAKKQPPKKLAGRRRVRELLSSSTTRKNKTEPKPLNAIINQKVYCEEWKLSICIIKIKLI
jgi:hypothetical protein